MALQYCTVNDPDGMAYLISMGEDCITTDYPDLLYQVMQLYFTGSEPDIPFQPPIHRHSCPPGLRSPDSRSHQRRCLR